MNPYEILAKEGEYFILPRFPNNEKDSGLYNQVFNCWEKVWIDTYKELNLPESNLADDFFRQSLIVGIKLGSEIVGCHLYSFFNLSCSSHLKTSYMSQNYPSIYIEQLRKRRALHAMSWEYLTVSPQFRKSKTGVSYSRIITYLASRILAESGSDVAIAPTRNSHKVNDIAYELGATCLNKNVDNHNVKADLIAVFRDEILIPNNEEVVKAADELWNRRNDLAGLNVSNTFKKAA